MHNFRIIVNRCLNVKRRAPAYLTVVHQVEGVCPGMSHEEQNLLIRGKRGGERRTAKEGFAFDETDREIAE